MVTAKKEEEGGGDKWRDLISALLYGGGQERNGVEAITDFAMLKPYCWETKA